MKRKCLHGRWALAGGFCPPGCPPDTNHASRIEVSSPPNVSHASPDVSTRLQRAAALPALLEPVTVTFGWTEYSEYDADYRDHDIVGTVDYNVAPVIVNNTVIGWSVASAYHVTRSYSTPYSRHSPVEFVDENEWVGREDRVVVDEDGHIWAAGVNHTTNDIGWRCVTERDWMDEPYGHAPHDLPTGVYDTMEQATAAITVLQDTGRDPLPMPATIPAPFTNESVNDPWAGPPTPPF